MEELSTNSQLVIDALTPYQQGDLGIPRGLMDPKIEIYSAPRMTNSGSFTEAARAIAAERG